MSFFSPQCYSSHPFWSARVFALLDNYNNFSFPNTTKANTTVIDDVIVVDGQHETDKETEELNDSAGLKKNNNKHFLKIKYSPVI